MEVCADKDSKNQRQRQEEQLQTHGSNPRYL